jgi:hypothetical protein
MSESSRTTIVDIHEAAHGVGGEELGLKVVSITGVAKPDSGGHVRFETYEESQVSERGAMLAMGHAAVRYLLPDSEPAGHERDFERLEDLAKRHERTHPNLWSESHDCAHALVREPRVEFTIRWVAGALAERAERKLGMSSLQLGKAIADARDAFDASQRIYGQRARRANPASATPSEAPVRRSQNAADLEEELAARKARLKELGAARPTKRSATKKKTTSPPTKKAPTTTRKATPKSARPGWGSKGGWLAVESFTATVAGQRETITAGRSWLCNGHEIVQRHPDKFKATAGHLVPASTKTSPLG